MYIFYRNRFPWRMGRNLHRLHYWRGWRIRQVPTPVVQAAAPKATPAANASQKIVYAGSIQGALPPSVKAALNTPNLTDAQKKTQTVTNGGRVAALVGVVVPPR